MFATSHETLQTTDGVYWSIDTLTISHTNRTVAKSPLNIPATR